MWANGELYKPLAAPPPGRVAYSVRDLVKGLVFLGIQGLVMDKYSYMRLADPKDPVQLTSLAHRIGFAQLAGQCSRFRYYGIWSLSNAACVLSGLGYAGVDGKTGAPSWTRCKNVYILQVETANNWKELLDAWNSNTNIWLRNSVYKRLTRKGKVPGFPSAMATFLVSALWHGISIGYYFTFVLAGFFQYIARQLRRSLRPVFYEDVRSPNPTLGTLRNYTPAQIVYSLVSMVSVQVTVNFAVISFFTLDLKPSLYAWKSTAYYGMVIVVLALGALQLGAGRALKPFHKVQKAHTKRS